MVIGLKVHSMDITPKYPIVTSAEVPGGILEASSNQENVVSSGTLVQPKKVDTVGGMQPSPTTLTQGFGNDIFRISPEGIQLGGANFVDAPFSVNMQGNLKANAGTFGGTLSAPLGTIGGYTISSTALYAGTGATRIGLDTTQGIYLGSNTFATAPFSVTLDGTLKATTGTIGGWILGTDLLKSASSGARIELDKGKNRISVFDATNEKVVMGYLNGLPKHDGTGNWGAGNYGFWARTGDMLSIDGDSEYVSGDWLIQNDASYLVKDASDNTIIRLGTDTGEKGLFIYNTAGTQLAKFISTAIYVGSATSYLSYTTAGGLVISGNISATTGSIGGTTISATALTGGIIQTATSGKRIEMSGVSITAYDTDGSVSSVFNDDSYSDSVIYISPTGKRGGINIEISSNNVGFSINNKILNASYDLNSTMSTLIKSARITDSGSYTTSGNVSYIQSTYPYVSPTITAVITGTTTLQNITYTYQTNVSKNFKIEIDGNGTPNTFKWSDDGGATWDATGVSITGNDQSLIDGVKINFTTTTGGVIGDYWTFTTGAETTSSEILQNLYQNKTYASGTVLKITNLGTGKDIDGHTSKWYAKSDGTIHCEELQADGDIGGLAGTNTLTGTSNVAANSTGVGTIKFKGTTARDSAGFIKIYIGTTAYYVPVFSAITG